MPWRECLMMLNFLRRGWEFSTIRWWQKQLSATDVRDAELCILPEWIPYSVSYILEQNCVLLKNWPCETFKFNSVIGFSIRVYKKKIKETSVLKAQSPENIHTNNIKWTNSLQLVYIYIHMHIVILLSKKAMNLKENVKGYKRGLRARKGREKCCN